MTQEEYEKTDFYKYLQENNIKGFKIRDKKDQPKPKMPFGQWLLCLLFGVHLSNTQSNVYRKLK